MNPLLEPSALDHELPDFAAIDVADLVPTFRTALDDHDAEIAAITALADAPTWENTMDALELSGQMLQRVLAIIFNYAGTDATDEVVAVEETVAPELSAHWTRILLNRDLYARVQAMPAQPEGSENEALLAHWLRTFRRGGADLDDAGRAELSGIDTRLAELSTSFGRNLMTSTADHAVLVTDEQRLAGLSAARKAQLREDAASEGEDGWLIRLGLPSVQPILEDLADADLRREVSEASRARGAGNNSDIVLETARLRARRAELLGFGSHADFVAAEETARTVAAVDELLETVTPAAVDNAHGEYKRALDLAHVNGVVAEDLGESDWPYWAGKLRAEDLAVDTTELKKYFPLTRVLRDGVFYAAERLYGIRVTLRTDLVGYHPDVQVWEVTDADGTAIGLLLTDLFARSTKRGGAWMSSFVDQNNLIGQSPVVVNVLNIAKPAEGEEALLSLDEVTTLNSATGCTGCSPMCGTRACRARMSRGISWSSPVRSTRTGPWSRRFWRTTRGTWRPVSSCRRTSLPR